MTTTRAAAYIRVSDASQVDGHSLDAQERLFKEMCVSRGWTAGQVYREEGRSAHVDSIHKRPVFQQLLNDVEARLFDVVVVHTLDRWSRNMKVLMESLSILSRHNVGLVSITETLDYSTPQGKLLMQMLGGFAEFYSGMLSTHVKKGIGERALKGLHLGGIPFGYESCWKKAAGEKALVCDSEHPGGVHVHHEEGPAVAELFRMYASGNTTTSQLAGWLNSQGFRTRNMHKLAGGAGPRLFTVSSVRGILHNVFYAGHLTHGADLLPGSHQAIITRELFELVQASLKKNNGRSSTLTPTPAREYLLKGLIRCCYCGMPLWAQTYYNGHRYYREQFASRGGGACVGKSGSITCEAADSQVEQVIKALALPQAWMDRVLAQIHMVEDVKRMQEERGR